MNLVRLDKYISKQCFLSRADAKKSIIGGCVSVNGLICKECDKKIDIESEEVLFEGNRLNYSEHLYFLINKPAGIISASNDKSRRTVIDLLDDKYKKYGLSPVGRLDKDTTGFLLLTNDGDFLHKVISPKSNIKKKYIAELDGILDDSMVSEFKNGITLIDGTKCKSADLKIIDTNRAEIILTEGKYHEIKRMFGVLGLGVNNLHRISVGGFELPEELKTGEYIKLDRKEAEKVFE